MPQYDFKNVIGQDIAKRSVVAALESGTLSPTYLLEGPEGVGKATFALEFAKALNCTSPEIRPCGTCPSCQKINRFQHPDLWVLLPDKLKGEPLGQKGWVRPPGFHAQLKISIDQVREVEQEVTRAPLEARFRVVVVLNAENLTLEAQNAFLKVLEEHPSHTIFLLVSSRPTAILPTVRSRCRVLRFSLLSLEEFRRYPWPERGDLPIEVLYRLSSGSLGLARSLIDHAVLSIRNDLIDQWLERAKAGLVEFLNLLTVDMAQSQVVLWTLATLIRDFLAIKLGTPEIVANVDRIEDLRKLAQHLTLEQVESLFRRLGEVEEALRRNVSPRTAMLSLTGPLWEPHYLDLFRG